MVSVIVPCHNCEATVIRAISSVLNQSVKDLEVIAVDDGSTDSTHLLLTTMSRSDKRLTVVTQQNAGPGSARNVGIARASGNFIAFLDSDDWWLPWKLEEQLESLRNSDSGICGVRPGGRGRRTRAVGLDEMLFKNYFVTSSVVVKSQVLFENNFRFLEGKFYSEDYLLWLKILTRAKGVIIRGDSVVRTVARRGSLSSKLWRMEIGEIDTLVRFHCFWSSSGSKSQFTLLATLACCWSLFRFVGRLVTRAMDRI